MKLHDPEYKHKLLLHICVLFPCPRKTCRHKQLQLRITKMPMHSREAFISYIISPL